MEGYDVWEAFLTTDLPWITYWLTMFLMPAGIGAGVICIAQMNSFELPARRKNMFRLLFISVIIYLLMHFLREVFQYFLWPSLTVILPIVTFIEFMASGLIVLFISLYLISTADPQKLKKPILAFFFIITGINTLLLIISQFNNMYYCFNYEYVDEYTLLYIYYVRGDCYFISNIAPAVMMLADIVIYIRYHKKFDRGVAIAFWIYIVLPIAAAVAQIFYSEAQFIIWATVIATVVMFIAMMKQTTKEYEKQKAEFTRLDTELTMATRIQADMLPNIFPAFPERKEFDIYASMDPAKEVGGDFYDFFMVDDDHLGMVMADVSGKGVPAALFMMSSKILLKNYALMTKDPKAALEKTNYQICQNNREGMFVTVWLGILDIRTGVLTAANAGHEQPALKDPDGNFELYKDKHGLMVGYMDMVKYKTYELTLKKGSKLFLYTDGVAEATNAKEELFGTERMIEALRRAENGTPDEILAEVRKSVDDFVQDAPQFDDLTMLCFEYKGTEVS